MKISIISCAIFVVFLALTSAVEDGKYRPQAELTTLRTAPPTTTRAVVTPRCQWPYDRCDQYPNVYNDRRVPGYDPRYPGYDTTYEPRWNDRRDQQPRWDDPRRYDPRVGGVTRSWNRNYPVNRGIGVYDRPIRLDEKVDAKGYTYVYETARGVYAEEVGTYDVPGVGVGVGVKNPAGGVRIQGVVQIKDVAGGEIFRMDYQAHSKDPEVARRNPRADSNRVPPTLARALELMENYA